MKHSRLILVGMAALVTIFAIAGFAMWQSAAARDADNDGIPNEEDACPFVATGWDVPEGDDDCDGWTSPEEDWIGTLSNLNCGEDAWPPDFDDSGVVNILDVVQLTPPRYGSSEENPDTDGDTIPDYAPRYDIVPDGVINNLDMNKEVSFFNTTCTPDSDVDGFSDADEGLIGTNAAAACPATLEPNDEEEDAWPVDFDDNGIVNILDVVQVTPPRYGSSETNPDSDGDTIPDYDPRYDIVPDGAIDDLDVQKAADFFGSTCGADSDGDGFTDADELTIGTDPADACPDNSDHSAWPPDFDNNGIVNILDVVQVTPPRYGSSVGNPDSDGDTVPDYAPRYDIVPDGVINYADVQRMVAVFNTACAVDSDGDRFSDADEGLIGTNAASACPETTEPNDEEQDAWPPDFDDNGEVNILDVVILTPPIYGSSQGQPDYAARYDIVPDGVINALDVQRAVAVFNTNCAQQ